jgi:hypothetical protein
MTHSRPNGRSIILILLDNLIHPLRVVQARERGLVVHGHSLAQGDGHEALGLLGGADGDADGAGRADVVAHHRACREQSIKLKPKKYPGLSF